LSRLTHAAGRASDMSLQIYYDRTNRETPISTKCGNTVDAQFQHRFPLPGRQDLTWGTGYRVSDGATGAVPTVASIRPGGPRTFSTSSPGPVRADPGPPFVHRGREGGTEHLQRLGVPTERGLLWTRPSIRRYGVRVAGRADPSRIEEDLSIDVILVPQTTRSPA